MTSTWAFVLQIAACVITRSSTITRTTQCVVILWDQTLHVFFESQRKHVHQKTYQVADAKVQECQLSQARLPFLLSNLLSKLLLLALSCCAYYASQPVSLCHFCSTRLNMVTGQNKQGGADVFNRLILPARLSRNALLLGLGTCKHCNQRFTVKRSCRGQSMTWALLLARR